VGHDGGGEPAAILEERAGELEGTVVLVEAQLALALVEPGREGRRYPDRADLDGTFECMAVVGAGGEACVEEQRWRQPAAHQ